MGSSLSALLFDMERELFIVESGLNMIQNVQPGRWQILPTAKLAQLIRRKSPFSLAFPGHSIKL